MYRYFKCLPLFKFLAEVSRAIARLCNCADIACTHELGMGSISSPSDCCLESLLAPIYVYASSFALLDLPGDESLTFE